MSVVTLEAVVEGGQIKLPNGVHLPEQTKVYVIVPELKVEQIARVPSPRLAHPEQAADFAMEVFVEPPDAGV